MMPGPLYHNGPFMWSVTGAARGQPRGARRQVRRRAHAAADRPAPPRVDVRRADDDGAHLEAPRRRARALRRVVAEGRVASRRAVPAVAEGDVDRLARPRGDLGAVRAAPRRRRRRSSAAPTGSRTAARSARPLVRRDEGRARRRHRRRSGRDRRDLHASDRPGREDLQLRRRRGAAHRRRLGVARRHGRDRRRRLRVPRATARPT